MSNSDINRTADRSLQDGVAQKILGFFAGKRIELGKTPEESRSCNYIEKRALDSLGIVELVYFLEEQFGMSFGPEQLESPQFQTVDGIVSIITQPHRGDSSVSAAA